MKLGAECPPPGRLRSEYPQAPDSGVTSLPIAHRGANMARRSAVQNEQIVLSILAAERMPIGAYAIALAAVDHGAALAPSQVYRTLDRLITKEQVYRVECRNGFVARDGPADVCLICTACGLVTLRVAPHSSSLLRAHCEAEGFRDTRTVIEVLGLCAQCRPPSSASNYPETSC